MDEINIEIEFQANFKRILFQKYFQILSKKEFNMNTLCKLCKKIQICGIDCRNVLKHFKVCMPSSHDDFLVFSINNLMFSLILFNFYNFYQLHHPEDYKKYQEEVKQSSYEPKGVGDENKIDVEIKENSNKILCTKYYKIIATPGDNMTVVCRTCKFIHHSTNNTFMIFRIHLKVCNI